MKALLRHLYHSLRSRRLIRAAMLMMYVVTTIGMPMDLTGQTTPSGCQCSRDLRESNQCCCHTRQESAARLVKRSCCDSAPRADKPSEIELGSLCCSGGKDLSVQEIEKACFPEKHANRRAQSKGASAIHRSKTPTTVNHNSEPQVVLNSCSCGGKVLFGVLCNSEPRLVKARSALTLNCANDTAILYDCDPPQQPCLLLETPPPEAQLNLS